SGYALLADNIIVDYHYTDIPDTSNHPPVITSVIAQPEQVWMEGQSVISVTAYDPDEDPLQYTWHASGGNVSGTDSSALWIAPDTVGSFFITCTVHDGAGNSTHAGVNVTVIDTTEHQYPDLVAYYPFNGNANDESEQNHDGSVFGAQLVPDRHDNQAAAYRFDGQNDRIQIPNSTQLNFQDAITVTFWLKPEEIPAAGETYPLSHGSWEERWKFSFMSNRRLRWTVNAQNGTGDLDSDTQLDTSHYYFVAGVYDGAHLKLFINGQHETTKTLTGGIKQTGLDITIGQSKPGVTAYNFNGIIDDVRLYSIALSDSAIAALYQQELVVDYDDPTLPSIFTLRTNYPNPFNPVTTIEFELPIPTHVTLTIVNLLGKKVAVLVDDHHSPGLHRVNWNARNFASGIYFYRLQTKEFSAIKKCLVVK
ncbi:MAG: T9SS type A sorting domain-containing protein, partial [Candidatus Marinimicrobia bacterium]|nr:T9SS type A sorting domain-containing protein [Candidatus Neomarinimicrobiota bacterium]